MEDKRDAVNNADTVNNVYAADNARETHTESWDAAQPDTPGQPDSPAGQGGGSRPPRSRWFGRGIYGSKDVPIRLLDGVIIVFILAAVLLTLFSAVGGGFPVTFDTDGGTGVESQKLRYGQLAAEPETPLKAGYTFAGWYREDQPETKWNFETDKIGGELKLRAEWVPAGITVKFDLNGGTADGAAELEPISVTYLETYGPLPVPEKDGMRFAGWEYSGGVINADTTVTVTGEHVLTATWEPAKPDS